MRLSAKKLGLYVVAVATLWILYQYTAELTLERSQEISLLTSADKAIPFIPEFVLAYFSLYFFFWLPPIFSPSISFKSFCSLIYTIAPAFFASLIFYWILPSAYPRPDIPQDNSLALWALKDILWPLDLPNNTFPSTHVVVVTILLLALFRKFTLGFYTIYFLWGAAIIFSTLAVKQHYIADVTLGILIGLGAFLLMKKTFGLANPPP